MRNFTCSCIEHPGTFGNLGLLRYTFKFHFNDLTHFKCAIYWCHWLRLVYTIITVQYERSLQFYFNGMLRMPRSLIRTSKALIRFRGFVGISESSSTKPSTPSKWTLSASRMWDTRDTQKHSLNPYSVPIFIDETLSVFQAELMGFRRTCFTCLNNFDDT